MSAAAHPLSQQELLDQENKRYHAFINLALFLSVFTGVEIVVIFLPFPPAALFTVLISVSVIKFFCVILWFMHLIYDAPLLIILFVAGLLIAAGTMVALLNLIARSDIDPAILHDTSLIIHSSPASPVVYESSVA